MNLLDQAHYHLWAEKKFFEVLSKVSEENWVNPLSDFTKSLQQIYGHKTEVIWSWFELIFKQSSKTIDWNHAPNYESMSKQEIISEMSKLLIKILAYLESTKEINLTLDLQWVKKPYPVTSYEILFNFFNHLTYHRGQIAFMFKKFGFEVPETDYNPYLYEKKNLL